METREYRYVDKTDWDRGEWDDEPDKLQWQDAKTGLPCLAVRGPAGALCGYVGVPEGHPYFEQHYNAEALDELRVHGGLTFSDHCNENNKEHGICHVPAPGEPDNVWWLGFDCAHAGDIMPTVLASIRKCEKDGDKEWIKAFKGDKYRNLDYVKTECRKLARQLAAVK